MMVLSMEGDMVISIIEVEAVDIGDESQVIDAEEDGVDEMMGSVICFKDVDFIVIYVRGMVRESGSGPQWFSEDGGLRAHSAAPEDDGFFGIREEGVPGCYN